MGIDSEGNGKQKIKIYLARCYRKIPRNVERSLAVALTFTASVCCGRQLHPI